MTITQPRDEQGFHQRNLVLGFGVDNDKQFGSFLIHGESPGSIAVKNSFDREAGTFSEVRDQCSRGQTFEVLQYVFLGTAIASGGVGAYLLLRNEDAGAAGSAPRFALRPSAGPDGARLDASLRF